jgi:hypothetical protein
VTLGLAENRATRTRLTAPAPGSRIILPTSPPGSGFTPIKSKKSLAGGFSATPEAGAGSGPSATMVTIVTPPSTAV